MCFVWSEQCFEKRRFYFKITFLASSEKLEGMMTQVFAGDMARPELSSSCPFGSGQPQCPPHPIVSPSACVIHSLSRTGTAGMHIGACLHYLRITSQSALPPSLQPCLRAQGDCVWWDQTYLPVRSLSSPALLPSVVWMQQPQDHQGVIRNTKFSLCPRPP